MPQELGSGEQESPFAAPGGLTPEQKSLLLSQPFGLEGGRQPRGYEISKNIEKLETPPSLVELEVKELLCASLETSSRPISGDWKLAAYVFEPLAHRAKKTESAAQRQDLERKELTEIEGKEREFFAARTQSLKRRLADSEEDLLGLEELPEIERIRFLAKAVVDVTGVARERYIYTNADYEKLRDWFMHGGKETFSTAELSGLFEQIPGLEKALRATVALHLGDIQAADVPKYLQLDPLKFTAGDREKFMNWVVDQTGLNPDYLLARKLVEILLAEVLGATDLDTWLSVIHDVDGNIRPRSDDELPKPGIGTLMNFSDVQKDNFKIMWEIIRVLGEADKGRKAGPLARLIARPHSAHKDFFHTYQVYLRGGRVVPCEEVRRVEDLAKEGDLGKKKRDAIKKSWGAMTVFDAWYKGKIPMTEVLRGVFNGAPDLWFYITFQEINVKEARDENNPDKIMAQFMVPELARGLAKSIQVAYGENYIGAVMEKINLVISRCLSVGLVPGVELKNLSTSVDVFMAESIAASLKKGSASGVLGAIRSVLFQAGWFQDQAVWRLIENTLGNNQRALSLSDLDPRELQTVIGAAQKEKQAEVVGRMWGMTPERIRIMASLEEQLQKRIWANIEAKKSSLEGCTDSIEWLRKSFGVIPLKRRQEIRKGYIG